MARVTKEGLLRQRKALELALRELVTGKIKRTSGHLFRATAQMGGPRLDTADQRVASVEKRIAHIDDRIRQGDHA